MASRIALVVNALAGEELRAGKADSAHVFQILISRDLGDCDAGKAKLVQDCPDRKTFDDALQGALGGWNPTDQLVFYFSGHGEERNGQYQLVFGDKRKSYYPFSSVLVELGSAGVTRAILVLDSCNSGAVLRGGKKASISEYRPPAEEIPTGVAVVTSCRATEKSYESEELNQSVFTALFCDGIDTGLNGAPTIDGRISIGDLVSYINQEIKDNGKYVGYSQTSMFGIDGAERQIWIAHNRSGSTASVAEAKRRPPVRSIDELRLAYERTASSRHPCEGATLEHLNWNLVTAHARVGNPSLASEADHLHVVRELGLLSPIPVGDVELLHKAAILCFCDHPTRFFPQSKALFVTGDIGATQFKRVQISKPLSEQIRDLVDLTMNSLESISTFGIGGVRGEVSEIPLQVVRELISNAVVHRNYEAKGSVQVRVTADALEVSLCVRMGETIPCR